MLVSRLFWVVWVVCLVFELFAGDSVRFLLLARFLSGFACCVLGFAWEILGSTEVIDDSVDSEDEIGVAPAQPPKTPKTPQAAGTSPHTPVARVGVPNGSNGSDATKNGSNVPRSKLNGASGGLRRNGKGGLHLNASIASLEKTPILSDDDESTNSPKGMNDGADGGITPKIDSDSEWCETEEQDVDMDNSHKNCFNNGSVPKPGVRAMRQATKLPTLFRTDSLVTMKDFDEKSESNNNNNFENKNSSKSENKSVENTNGSNGDMDEIGVGMSRLSSKNNNTTNDKSKTCDLRQKREKGRKRSRSELDEDDLDQVMKNTMQSVTDNNKHSTSEKNEQNSHSHSNGKVEDENLRHESGNKRRRVSKTSFVELHTSPPVAPVEPVSESNGLSGKKVALSVLANVPTIVQSHGPPHGSDEKHEMHLQRETTRMSPEIVKFDSIVEKKSEKSSDANGESDSKIKRKSGNDASNVK